MGLFYSAFSVYSAFALLSNETLKTKKREDCPRYILSDYDRNYTKQAIKIRTNTQGEKGQLWKKFRQNYFKDIKELINKSQFKTKLRISFWYIFIGLVVAGVIFIIFSYTIFLAFIIGALSCLYVVIRKAYIDPLNEAFRLGLQYTEDEFMAYILYVIAQLYNLIPVSKKER